MLPSRAAARLAAVVLVTLVVAQTAVGPAVAVAGLGSGDGYRYGHGHEHTLGSASEPRGVSPATSRGGDGSPSWTSAARPAERHLGDREEGPVVDETFTFARDETPGTVELRITYEVPSSVAAFDLHLPGLAGSSVSVVESEGFERRGETTFEWTGSTATPSVDLRLSVATDDVAVGDRGIERDGWAFATVPESGIDVTYRGARPRLVSTTTVDGEGYGTDRMAFMGSYDAVEATGDDGEEVVTFVVGEGTATTNLSAARTFVDRARGRFDFGVRRDRLVVFVLPYERSRSNATAPGVFVTGEAFGDAFWVTADATAVADPRNAFAHEYVHSRLADVGDGSAAWLTEATAEYYGYLSTLNAGGATYPTFHDAATAERFTPNRTGVVLADPETWRGTLGDYEKGAHVLAALDVEIRERTDGERTLYDVFTATRRFDDYAAFRAQVVETAGDDSLGGWLDRYVTTEALPPVPNDPARYVHGADLDPDGDGLVSGREVDGEPPTNPFVADTDADGLNDSYERTVGTDPTRRDTDGDTIADADELDAGTDPTAADTDGDGTNDAIDAYPTDPAVRTDRPARVDADPKNETDVEDRDGDGNEDETTAERGPPTESADPTAVGTASGVGAGGGSDASAESGAAERIRSRVDTPGFGVGVAVAAAALAGMLLRRENRDSF